MAHHNMMGDGIMDMNIHEGNLTYIQSYIRAYIHTYTHIQDIQTMVAETTATVIYIRVKERETIEIEEVWMMNNYLGFILVIHFWLMKLCKKVSYMHTYIHAYMS